MSEEGGESGDPSLGPSGKDADEVLGSAKAVSKIEERGRALETEKSKVDLTLQRFVGYGGLGLMVAQLVVANLVFVKYADAKGWSQLPTGVIQVFLAATVVQVIGVVLIVARSVFPEGGRRKP
jgi:hypothetical protein